MKNKALIGTLVALAVVVVGAIVYSNINNNRNSKIIKHNTKNIKYNSTYIKHNTKKYNINTNNENKNTKNNNHKNLNLIN